MKRFVLGFGIGVVWLIVMASIFSPSVVDAITGEHG
jgi:hypothetical protein